VSRLLGEATEQALRACLEPDACCALPYTDGTLFAASTAVSAKRQADALDRIARALTGEGPSILTAPINSYGEGIGDANQGQLIRGNRGINQYEGR
jgi:hypothetical protein